jgi:hypothetical protein
MFLALTKKIEPTACKLISLTDKFRGFQDTKGCVVRDTNIANEILEKIMILARIIYCEIDRDDMADAFETDVKNWQSYGLNTPPDFAYSQATYTPPKNRLMTFFIGPFITTNGLAPRGNFFECFLAVRDEPEVLQPIYQQFPHPKNHCQSCHFLLGTVGLSTGNCIVFFPENIASSKTIKSQNFSLFFFNKFYRIYLSDTLPTVMSITGKQNWISSKLSSTEFYQARCLWGYLHDYYHHCGLRPLDLNLQVKLNWFSGLLEEVKVDCLTAITAYQQDILFGREIIEFIIFERVFRYPYQPDATNNFDAGTGVLLFEWLFHHQAITVTCDSYLQIDLEICVNSMQDLVKQIEDIERHLDNQEYLRLAKELVRKFLPEGRSGQRFSFPKTFSDLVNNRFQPKLNTVAIG